MYSRTLFWGGLLGLSVLFALCLFFRRGPIETDLTERSREELMAVLPSALAHNIHVSFAGRDATLQGQVPSETERSTAGQAVAGVWGVRTVDNRLITADGAPEDTEAVPAVSSRLRLRAEAGDRVVLDGVVPEAALRDSLVRHAERVFHGAAIVDQIEVAPDARPAGWMASVLALMPTAADLHGPTLEATEQTIRLSGLVDSLSRQSAVEEEARRHVGALFTLHTDLVLTERARADLDRRADLERRLAEVLRTTRINFDLNTADLTAASRGALDQMASILSEFPAVQIEVQGHTDHSGTPDLNTALSQARAEAVRAYLVARGLNAARLTAIGYGNNRPLHDDPAPESQDLNRRVEFRIIGGV